MANKLLFGTGFSSPAIYKTAEAVYYDAIGGSNLPSYCARISKDSVGDARLIPVQDINNSIAARTLQSPGLQPTYEATMGETWHKNLESPATYTSPFLYSIDPVNVKPTALDISSGNASNGYEVHFHQNNRQGNLVTGITDGQKEYVHFRFFVNSDEYAFKWANENTNNANFIEFRKIGTVGYIAPTIIGGNNSSNGVPANNNRLAIEFKFRVFTRYNGATYDVYLKYSCYNRGGDFNSGYFNLGDYGASIPTLNNCYLHMGGNQRSGAYVSSYSNLSLYGVSSADSSTYYTNLATGDFTAIRRYYPVLKNTSAQSGTTGWDTSPTPTGGSDATNTTAAYDALRDGNDATFGTTETTDKLGYTNTTSFSNIVTTKSYITINGTLDVPSFGSLKSLTNIAYRIADDDGESIAMTLGNEDLTIAGQPGTNGTLVQSYTTDSAEWATLKDGANPIAGTDTGIPFKVGRV